MPTTMTKSDLIKAVHARADVSRVRSSEVEKIVDTLGLIVREQAAAGVTVSVPGLGRFSQKVRPPRVGRNPATGAPIDIPETARLTFKAGKAKA